MIQFVLKYQIHLAQEPLETDVSLFSQLDWKLEESLKISSLKNIFCILLALNQILYHETWKYCYLNQLSSLCWDLIGEKYFPASLPQQHSNSQCLFLSLSEPRKSPAKHASGFCSPKGDILHWARSSFRGISRLRIHAVMVSISEGVWSVWRYCLFTSWNKMWPESDL